MDKQEKLLSTFRNIADAITGKYQAEIKMMTAKTGSRPSFEELMEQLKKMQNELTKEGLNVIEGCSAEQELDVEKITDQVKDTIQQVTEEFIKQL